MSSPSNSAGAGTVIAIDGPSGSGKSTVAQALADRLGYRHLDTGAMYRVVTLLAVRAGVTHDEQAAAALAAGMSLDLGERVLVEGEDVTEAIRSPEVDAAVSGVAAFPAVRSELVKRQRAWVSDSPGASAGTVVEGRDIGSVVFPDARLKIYLTAEHSVRAKRRLDQQTEQAAESDASGTATALSRRDHLDSSRSASPLVVPDGAVVVDSTDHTVEEVVEEVLSHL